MRSQIEQYVIDRVREIRLSQNVSQAMLAYGIGVSPGFIGQVESPYSPTKYNLNHINDIALYLNCSPADFMPPLPFQNEKRDDD